ncbi:kinase-like protein [Viridothelium virens]|uniref:Kinase-like protein n=1 Tax=Viridothelium virens TaxID=1048519 RepID=A0A6A6HFA3_VIRVR|nr:kinase-like protein [Viridothelium virens]
MTDVRASTPPVSIASPVTVRNATLSPPEDLLVEHRLDIDAVKSKAAKKKKKRRNNKLPAAPAATTIYGFQTPVTSGGEESDYSSTGSPRLGTRGRNLPSVTSSPSLSAVANGGGISALRLQLDALNIQNGARSPSQRSASKLRSNLSSPDGSSRTLSDGDRTEMDCYEIPLQDDFVSPELGSKSIISAIEGGLRQDSIVRKMTASDFEPLTCLGKGTFGTVLLVKQRATGRLYAQKQFRKASLTVHKIVEQTKTERTILESLRHPYLVKLFYAFQDHEKLYLILEYAQGGELFTHLLAEKMFTEDVAAFYMAEMVLALEHLHTNIGVIYRDLKPENCLLDSEGHLLLTDFGLSKVAVDDDTRCNSILGTVEYMAPEVIQGQDYGMVVDYWSLGAIGFDLLTGGPPFTGPNHAKIQEKILKSKLTLPYFLGPDAKDLLTRLLRKEPKKRLGANMPKDLQTIKKHRFFRKIDWKALGKRELEPPIKPLITDPELAENFSREFTELAVSPVATTAGKSFEEMMATKEEGNVFGGFSFVASQSLLDSGEWGF